LCIINRYDDNVTNEYNLQKKRSRKISTRHKQEYSDSDSSFESDSCDYSHDERAENGATKHRLHAKNQQEKEKSKSFNETEIKNNSRKEDDDDQSVSDDSLEVIVVKRSLEKKCEKVVSGRRLKTPRECTKETKLTKTHKRNSKKTSRSSKSRTFVKDENAVDESPDKEEESIAVEEPTHISAEEDEGDSERIIESRYRRDATDSTSQETVERVIVTAMVHKDHIPDTPRSAQKTAKEISSDGVLRKRTLVTEETKEIFKDISSSDKSKIALSHKTSTHDISQEKLQQITHENSRINEEIHDKRNKITMPINMENAKDTNSTTQSKNLNVIIFFIK